METPTTNMGLPQFQGTDDLAYSDINGAFSAIDRLAVPTVCTAATRPAEDLFVGRTIYETDTKKTLFWNGSAWVSFNTAGSDSGWITVAPPSGWTVPTGPGWQYRRINNEVHFHGVWTNAAFTGGHTTLFTLPAGYRPTTDTALALSHNTAVARTAYVNNLGEVRVYAETTSPAWWTVSGVLLTD